MAVTIDEAMELIYKNISAVSIETINIENSSGRILAQNVTSTHNLPPYDNSAMDGFAVKKGDEGECVKVTNTILAGDKSDFLLSSGEAIRIMTGAKIPTGTEVIVPIEDTTTCSTCSDGIVLPKLLKEGNHIRLCGEDVQSNETILNFSESLNAYKIALLASQGITHIQVYKKPRVALIATGSEIKMHFETIDEYELYNTNAIALQARCSELNCETILLHSVEDNLENIKELIASTLDCDLVITSGGISVGDADYTKEAFEAYEYENIFEHIKIKPGKPTTFGKIGKSFILNLPGNPLACMMNFELFGQSMILALSGVQEKYINTIEATLSQNIKIKKGRDTLVPGYFDGTSFKASTKFAPGMVSPLAHANSYTVIDESCDGVEANQKIKVIPTTHQITSKSKIDFKNRCWN
ncbi:MAG: molybdopterin molybdotransferase MoeA [Campylobacterota bacterium]|nr:molybdopterin molybdotransferase MoeA [Campylobacterota bacterium]